MKLGIGLDAPSDSGLNDGAWRSCQQRRRRPPVARPGTSAGAAAAAVATDGPPTLTWAAPGVGGRR